MSTPSGPTTYHSSKPGRRYVARFAEASGVTASTAERSPAQPQRAAVGCQRHAASSRSGLTSTPRSPKTARRPCAALFARKPPVVGSRRCSEAASRWTAAMYAARSAGVITPVELAAGCVDGRATSVDAGLPASSSPLATRAGLSAEQDPRPRSKTSPRATRTKRRREAIKGASREAFNRRPRARRMLDITSELDSRRTAGPPRPSVSCVHSSLQRWLASPRSVLDQTPDPTSSAETVSIENTGIRRARAPAGWAFSRSEPHRQFARRDTLRRGGRGDCAGSRPREAASRARRARARRGP